jgi:hypothetical protein
MKGRKRSFVDFISNVFMLWLDLNHCFSVWVEELPSMLLSGMIVVDLHEK